MVDNKDNSEKQYYNLTDYSFSHMSPHVPDSTALSFADISSPSAWVTYQAGGAGEVTAGIYSWPGTFITYNPVDFEYYLGVLQNNVPSGTKQQALYSAASDAVYINGGAGQLHYGYFSGDYKFGQVVTPAKAPLIGYGINFYYSNDGKSFTRIPQVQHTKLLYDTMNSPTGAFYYEEYTAAVPSGAAYIRVEINDVTSLPMEEGGVLSKAKKSMTALASVTIIGENLVMGPPAPPVPEPPPPSSGVVSAPSSSTRRSTSESASTQPDENLLSAQSTRETSEKSSSVKASSSKFEGTITSSPKSSRSPSSNASSKSASSSQRSSKVPDKPVESEPDRGETVIYEIRRPEDGKQFSGAVAAYIAVVTAALFFVVLMPKAK